MSTSSRFASGTDPISLGRDNTDRILNNQFIQPAFASTIAINPSNANTLVQLALTGACTISVGVGSASTAPYVGDKITFLFTAASTEIVTFGTGTLPTATLSVTGTKTASISFIFNGASWCETARSVTA